MKKNYKLRIHQVQEYFSVNKIIFKGSQGQLGCYQRIEKIFWAVLNSNIFI